MQKKYLQFFKKKRNFADGFHKKTNKTKTMKKLMILSTVAALAALFTSCGKDSLSLTPSSLQFESTSAAPQSIAVKADGEWTLSVETGVTWLHISTTIGTGSAPVTVTVGDNTSSNSRTAYITLTCNGVSKMASVTQAAYTVGEPNKEITEYSNLPVGAAAYYPMYSANDYVTGPNSYGDLGMFEKIKFPVSGTLNYVSFGAQKAATVTGSINVKVYAADKTTVLGTKTVNMSEVATNAGWTDVTFSTPIPIVAETFYYIGVQWDAAFPLTNEFAITANDYTVVESAASTAWSIDKLNAWSDIKVLNDWSHNVNLYIFGGVEHVISGGATKSPKMPRPSLENAASRTISTNRK
ncbi:hypothetical protein FACS1894178_0650 [Bacteroidia bacterium]|nr:hypothetical protein FACS1894178_0650 [Bacteroidia bacterium]